MFFVVKYKNEVVIHGYAPSFDAGHDVLDVLKIGDEYTISVYGSIKEYLENL